MTLVSTLATISNANRGRLKYIAGNPLQGQSLAGVIILHDFWVLANGAVLPGSGVTAGLSALLGTRFGLQGALPVLIDGVVPIPKGASAFPTVGVAGGEISHILQLAEYPAHSHSTLDNLGPNRGNALDGYLNVDGFPGRTQVVFNGPGYVLKTSTVAGGGAAHENMPPNQVGGFVLVRL